ncbi:hypothetical protein [Methanobrevibacter thaueri]|uniref:Apea-like HEPN domain-containing protein n=1 Tax=Methanobrevibacter thaueri TaxID=190975 RepID=A0A315XPP0_9EURY|nr:hypothetical protein [Methanobrevibacter thaueri]PWB88387.1 hypothetical protein MBBTH_00200 [Methanobrevibacter thaueri]
MNFEKYIDEITKLIESNINRVNSRHFLENEVYHLSSENFFELSLEEYEELSEIVNEISNGNNLSAKFPKNYIFDQLVREVIIKSYNLDSRHEEIKLNLKSRFNEFEEILNDGFKEWTYFIPVSGITVDDTIDFGSMIIYPFETFKNEILDCLNNNNISEDSIDYKIIMDYMQNLKPFCFVKLTTSGTKESSKDKALSKVNELLSIFSLYKPPHINGFGIMGDVLPLSSEIIAFFINQDDLNTTRKRTIRVRPFNLSESLEHMRKFHLAYLINLINKEELEYIEENLLNAIQWYYESVKREVNFDKDVVESTQYSKEYNAHYTYFKLGIKIINLVSSLESLLVFNDGVKMDTRKERFNLIMNFRKDSIYDYSDELDDLYYIRNDIAHSNRLCDLLKMNIIKNTNLLNIFIMNFIEIKLSFDNDSKSLNSKEDLNNFYNGKNRLKGQFDYMKTLNKNDN